MTLFRWLRRSFGKSPPARGRKPRRPAPRLEYLEDRTLFAVRALSSAAAGLLSDAAAGNVYNPASVSKDGRFAVYTDTAANLAPGQVMDSTTFADVFLFDRATGKTTLVSHAVDST